MTQITSSIILQKIVHFASGGLLLFLLGLFLVILHPLSTTSIDTVGAVLGHFLPVIGRTIALSLSVGFVSILIALLAVFAVRIMSVRLQSIIQFFLVLPLLFPPYIAALTYIDILRSPWGLEVFGRSDLMSFVQAVFVLSFFLYPYSFLLVKNRLEMIDPSHRKILALYPVSMWNRIRLLYIPHLAGTIWSGFIISFLYVIADLGAVSILRMDTVTTELYQTLVKRFDQTEGAILSLVLIVLAAVGMHVRNQGFGSGTTSLRAGEAFVKAPRVWQDLSVIFLSILIILTVFVPIFKISMWFYEFLQSNSVLKGIWFSPDEIGLTTLTTLLLGVTVVSVIHVLVIIVQTVRVWYRARAVLQMLSGSLIFYSALPAIVIVYGLLSISRTEILGFLPALVILLLAYVTKFGAGVFLTLSPAFDMIPRSYIKIGETYIHSLFGQFKTVILPYVRKPLFQSINYVLFLVLRELTIPLILLPLGYQVLSVRVWQAASEGLYAYASPFIILLMLLSLPFLLWYIRTQNSSY